LSLRFSSVDMGWYVAVRFDRCREVFIATQPNRHDQDRTEAASTGLVKLQIVRDWVINANAMAAPDRP
jgi:hypothetical protein